MTMHFDFDRWARIARDDPQRFEQLRQEAIDEVINSASAPNQARLRGLQFQVDARRRVAGSALGSCIQISSMMLDHFYNEIVTSINAFVNDDLESLKVPILDDCKVIPLYKN